jgi:putative hydrolase of the HAD superfamily
LTFDLWNTIYSADGASAEIVRPRRLELLARVLALHGVRPSDDDLRQAYRTGFDAYMAAWTSGRHFGAREQVLHMLGYFGVGARPGSVVDPSGTGDPGAVDLEAVARTAIAIEDASRLAPPALLPGVRETIPVLAAGGYRLGLISDTSLTPGRVLRDFLAADGLLDCFSALTFSDETGFPKPDRRMFEGTLAHLGPLPGRPAVPAQAAHVGDIPRTDIAGAKALGMVTIRCAAVNDHPEPPEADFVIRDHREIPAILGRKAAGPDRRGPVSPPKPSARAAAPAPAEA